MIPSVPSLAGPGSSAIFSTAPSRATKTISDGVSDARTSASEPSFATLGAEPPGNTGNGAPDTASVSSEKAIAHSPGLVDSRRYTMWPVGE